MDGTLERRKRGMEIQPGHQPGFAGESSEQQTAFSESNRRWVFLDGRFSCILVIFFLGWFETIIQTSVHPHFYPQQKCLSITVYDIVCTLHILLAHVYMLCRTKAHAGSAELLGVRGL